MGSVFHLDLDNAGSWKEPSLKSYILEAIKKLGGKVDLIYNQDCTHVILRHKEQELYAAAQQLDQSVVSAEYMLKCISQQKLLEETEDGIYAGKEIPGFKEMVAEMTQTDFRGMDRMIVRYKCECTGAPYSGIMTVPSKTSHLVVKDLGSGTEKMEKARRHPQVHIVRADWLDECLKIWKYIPEVEFKMEGQVLESDDEPVGADASHKEIDDEHAGPKYGSDLDPTLAIDGDEEDPPKPSQGKVDDRGVGSQEIKGNATHATSQFDLNMGSQAPDMSQQVALAKGVAGQFASQMNADVDTRPAADKSNSKRDVESPEGNKSTTPPGQNPPFNEVPDEISPLKNSEANDGTLDLCPATVPLEDDLDANGLGEEAENDVVMETPVGDMAANAASNGATNTVRRLRNNLDNSNRRQGNEKQRNQGRESEERAKSTGARTTQRTKKAGKPLDNDYVLETPAKRGRKKKVAVVKEAVNGQKSDRMIKDPEPIQPRTPVKRKKMAVASAQVVTRRGSLDEQTPKRHQKTEKAAADEAVAAAAGPSRANRHSTPEPVTRQTPNKRQRITPAHARHDRKDHVYTLSKMTGTEKVEPIKLLKRLGARVSHGLPGKPHAYEDSVTHLVIGTLVRTEKVMCVLAAGGWILTSEFLDQCEKSNSLQNPEKFEHQATNNELIEEGVPKHWRLRCQNLGIGAFDGIKAVFYGTMPAPGNAVLEQILVAGGGAVLRRTPPYDTVCNTGEVNLAIIAESKSETRDRHISTLRSAGIVCARSGYILDWLCCPSTSLAKHKMTGKGKKKDTLSTLEARRGKGATVD